jgi:hypothetical protein
MKLKDISAQLKLKSSFLLVKCYRISHTYHTNRLVIFRSESEIPAGRYILFNRKTIKYMKHKTKFRDKK